MAAAKQSLTQKRISNLEMANEMFKTAFAVKKQKLHQKFPQLSDSELNKKTVEYFRELSED